MFLVFSITVTRLQLRSIAADENHLSSSEVQLQKYMHNLKYNGLSSNKRKRLISGISKMIGKALSWMLVTSYATKITRKH